MFGFFFFGGGAGGHVCVYMAHTVSTFLTLNSSSPLVINLSMEKTMVTKVISELKFVSLMNIFLEKLAYGAKLAHGEYI